MNELNPSLSYRDNSNYTHDNSGEDSGFSTGADTLHTRARAKYADLLQGTAGGVSAPSVADGPGSIESIAYRATSNYFARVLGLPKDDAGKISFDKENVLRHFDWKNERVADLTIDSIFEDVIGQVAAERSRRGQGSRSNVNAHPDLTASKFSADPADYESRLDQMVQSIGGPELLKALREASDAIISSLDEDEEEQEESGIVGPSLSAPDMPTVSRLGPTSSLSQVPGASPLSGASRAPSPRVDSEEAKAAQEKITEALKSGGEDLVSLSENDELMQHASEEQKSEMITKLKEHSDKKGKCDSRPEGNKADRAIANVMQSVKDENEFNSLMKAHDGKDLIHALEYDEAKQSLVQAAAAWGGDEFIDDKLKEKYSKEIAASKELFVNPPDQSSTIQAPSASHYSSDPTATGMDRVQSETNAYIEEQAYTNLSPRAQRELQLLNAQRASEGKSAVENTDLITEVEELRAQTLAHIEPGDEASYKKHWDAWKDGLEKIRKEQEMDKDAFRHIVTSRYENFYLGTNVSFGEPDSAEKDKDERSNEEKYHSYTRDAADLEQLREKYGQPPASPVNGLEASSSLGATGVAAQAAQEELHKLLQEYEQVVEEAGFESSRAAILRQEIADLEESSSDYTKDLNKIGVELDSLYQPPPADTFWLKFTEVFLAVTELAMTLAAAAFLGPAGVALVSAGWAIYHATQKDWMAMAGSLAGGAVGGLGAASGAIAKSAAKGSQTGAALARGIGSQAATSGAKSASTFSQNVNNLVAKTGKAGQFMGLNPADDILITTGKFINIGQTGFETGYAAAQGDALGAVSSGLGLSQEGMSATRLTRTLQNSATAGVTTAYGVQAGQKFADGDYQGAFDLIGGLSNMGNMSGSNDYFKAGIGGVNEGLPTIDYSRSGNPDTLPTPADPEQQPLLGSHEEDTDTVDASEETKRTEETEAAEKAEAAEATKRIQAAEATKRIQAAKAAEHKRFTGRSSQVKVELMLENTLGADVAKYIDAYYDPTMPEGQARYTPDPDEQGKLQLSYGPKNNAQNIQWHVEHLNALLQYNENKGVGDLIPALSTPEAITQLEFDKHEKLIEKAQAVIDDTTGKYTAVDKAIAKETKKTYEKEFAGAVTEVQELNAAEMQELLELDAPQQLKALLLVSLRRSKSIQTHEKRQLLAFVQKTESQLFNETGLELKKEAEAQQLVRNSFIPNIANNIDVAYDPTLAKGDVRYTPDRDADGKLKLSFGPGANMQNIQWHIEHLDDLLDYEKDYATGRGDYVPEFSTPAAITQLEVDKHYKLIEKAKAVENDTADRYSLEQKEQAKTNRVIYEQALEALLQERFPNNAIHDQQLDGAGRRQVAGGKSVSDSELILEQGNYNLVDIYNKIHNSKGDAFEPGNATPEQKAKYKQWLDFVRQVELKEDDEGYKKLSKKIGDDIEVLNPNDNMPVEIAHGLDAELSDEGRLSFEIFMPRDKRDAIYNSVQEQWPNIRGADLYAMMMLALGDDVQYIDSEWQPEGALADNNKAFWSEYDKHPGLPTNERVEKAAFGTFSGKMAQKFGFTEVKIKYADKINRDSNLELTFSKPETLPAVLNERTSDNASALIDQGKVFMENAVASTEEYAQHTDQPEAKLLADTAKKTRDALKSTYDAILAAEQAAQETEIARDSGADNSVIAQKAEQAKQKAEEAVEAVSKVRDTVETFISRADDALGTEHSETVDHVRRDVQAVQENFNQLSELTNQAVSNATDVEKTTGAVAGAEIVDRIKNGESLIKVEVDNAAVFEAEDLSTALFEKLTKIAEVPVGRDLLQQIEQNTHKHEVKILLIQKKDYPVTLTSALKSGVLEKYGKWKDLSESEFREVMKASHSISNAQENISEPKFGAPTSVVFAPEENTIFFDGVHFPPDVTLFHELVHASHFVEGRSRKGELYQETDREESATVGMGPDLKGPTENLYRLQQGLSLRESYDGELFFQSQESEATIEDYLGRKDFFKDDVFDFKFNLMYDPDLGKDEVQYNVPYKDKSAITLSYGPTSNWFNLLFHARHVETAAHYNDIKNGNDKIADLFPNLDDDYRAQFQFEYDLYSKMIGYAEEVITSPDSNPLEKHLARNNQRNYEAQLEQLAAMTHGTDGLGDYRFSFNRNVGVPMKQRDESLTYDEMDRRYQEKSSNPKSDPIEAGLGYSADEIRELPAQAVTQLFYNKSSDDHRKSLIENLTPEGFSALMESVRTEDDWVFLIKNANPEEVTQMLLETEGDIEQRETLVSHLSPSQLFKLIQGNSDNSELMDMLKELGIDKNIKESLVNNFTEQDWADLIQNSNLDQVRKIISDLHHKERRKILKDEPVGLISRNSIRQNHGLSLDDIIKTFNDSTSDTERKVLLQNLPRQGVTSLLENVKTKDDWIFVLKNSDTDQLRHTILESKNDPEQRSEIMEQLSHQQLYKLVETNSKDRMLMKLLLDTEGIENKNSQVIRNILKDVRTDEKIINQINAQLSLAQKGKLIREYDIDPEITNAIIHGLDLDEIYDLIDNNQDPSFRNTIIDNLNERQYVGLPEKIKDNPPFQKFLLENFEGEQLFAFILNNFDDPYVHQNFTRKLDEFDVARLYYLAGPVRGNLLQNLDYRQVEKLAYKIDKDSRGSSQFFKNLPAKTIQQIFNDAEVDRDIKEKIFHNLSVSQQNRYPHFTV